MRTLTDQAITGHDGIAILADVYLPDTDGPFPTLYAVSPYQKDLAYLPATSAFRFRETRAHRLVGRPRRLRLRPRRPAGHGRVRRHVRPVLPRRAAGLPRHRRVDRRPALVDRAGGHGRRVFLEEHIRPWYDHWLKGDDNGVDELPPVRIDVQNGPGIRAEQEWPLARAVPTPFYSDQTDTQFFVKVSEQTHVPKLKEVVMSHVAHDVPPPSTAVTRGWLLASHRALDADRSTELAPYHTHVDPQPVTPGEIVRYDIEVWPTSYLFKKGNRIRVEIANGDSMIADGLFHHYYGHRFGTDRFHHDATHPAHVLLPVIP